MTTTHWCSRKAAPRFDGYSIRDGPTPSASKHPAETIYTYWDYMRKRWERNAGLRIDHLLLNAELTARLVDANVDKAVRGNAGASDHAPTWIHVT